MQANDPEFDEALAAHLGGEAASAAPEGGRRPGGPLRTGFTTGACATAATAAAFGALATGIWRDPVSIFLPKGRRASFALAARGRVGEGAWAEVVKDAGDDPDVTHGARIRALVRPGPVGSGVRFRAGVGVGVVSKPGLPIPPGEPAINPVPREMMRATIGEIAAETGAGADLDVEISVAGGAALAEKTWNPRLGIVGGISILGTTGIVKPYSCAAWIASIHRGVDVARANGARHAIGSTGSTSERTAQALYGAPDWAMLDMGDFAGGLLKYLRAHPLPQLTLAGGFAKLTKFSQGALDLHSGRSQVDIAALGALAAARGLDADAVARCETAAQALIAAGPGLAAAVADATVERARAALDGAGVAVGVLIVDRTGSVVARRDPK